MVKIYYIRNYLINRRKNKKLPKYPNYIKNENNINIQNNLDKKFRNITNN